MQNEPQLQLSDIVSHLPVLTSLQLEMGGHNTKTAISVKWQNIYMCKYH